MFLISSLFDYPMIWNYYLDNGSEQSVDARSNSTFSDDEFQECQSFNGSNNGYRLNATVIHESSDGSDANQTVNIGNVTVKEDGADYSLLVGNHTLGNDIDMYDVDQEDLKLDEKSPLSIQAYHNIDEVPHDRAEVSFNEKIAQLQDELEKSIAAEAVPAFNSTFNKEPKIETEVLLNSEASNRVVETQLGMTEDDSSSIEESSKCKISNISQSPAKDENEPFVNKLNDAEESIDDPALSISPENATFSGAVTSSEHEQMSEPAANITLPSKNNPDEIVSVEKLEKDFDVEFKRPALPIFKSQGNPSKEEEFKICSDSCKRKK